MKKFLVLIVAMLLSSPSWAERIAELLSFPAITVTPCDTSFPLSAEGSTASIVFDANDHKVVSIAGGMLADDVERVTGFRPVVAACASLDAIPAGSAVIAGTVGRSALIDSLVSAGVIDASVIVGKWESYVVTTAEHPTTHSPLLVIAGSDRRGTAFGLTALSRAIGVSPWYWWADVEPAHKPALYVSAGRFVQYEPSVQYRGIFINDERFGGWARWVENTFDTETHQVGPKVYARVFELLLRLGGNYLWPAMHNGSRAFNANPENARLADDYAIVMGTSHCEQMLRNNEDEWKNVGTYGDFNFITNRQTMLDYWEERVKTNGAYENTYTLGLRGIHDYPMEGANTSAERVRLMQEALDAQREMLARNIDKPLAEIPQVLCPYEEVLEAYHDGLKVPDDVILLWSDDKQGYTRNLCNPQEMKRSGGAGIYYHLSYHGDPASWIWLSPLSPAFISTELTKAYTYGARKIWVFNVGDIKPAEKEINFAMDLAWDVDRWSPAKAHGYIAQWAAETFGDEFANDISAIMSEYYALMAAGKDAHVWFLSYPLTEIRERLDRWQKVAAKATRLAERIPERLQPAYFELILYPVCGAQMINEYQLLARTSMAQAAEAHSAQGASDARSASAQSLAEAERSQQMFDALNAWTKRYNEELLDGKWRNFFDWRPYHWYYSTDDQATKATPELIEQVAKMPAPAFLSVEDAVSTGVKIKVKAECEVPLWINALTPVQNFSKLPEDNVFCRVNVGKQSFDASATPINNIWHSPLIGPMWSQVGTVHLKKGVNVLRISDVKPEARIDQMFLGLYPPFPDAPLHTVAAVDFKVAFNGTTDAKITVVPQLGFSDGVTVLPFDTPSFDAAATDAPYAEYELTTTAEASTLEVRTLANLHVYEGRGARYAVQIDDAAPQTFDIHADDFSAEWRWNVLRGYASRSVSLKGIKAGRHKVRIYFLDPGIVLQEICLNR